MNTELPQIISDDEFAALLAERKRRARSEHDRWDNAGIRPPHKPGDGLPASTIEQKFPRIAEKLAAAWPSTACALYIASLIVNKREARQGFPNEVVEDLLMLHEINDMLLRNAGRAPDGSARPARGVGSPPGTRR